MLEKKQGQFWNLHQIPNKTSYPDFRFFLLFCCFFQFFSGLKISNCNFIWKSSIIEKKIRRKSKIKIRSFVRNLMQIPKLSLVFFFLALMVFYLFSFEGSKTHFTGDKYVYICMYWVLLGGFDAINASNQRTICSCMIFQPSCFILYFLLTRSFSIKFSIMMSPLHVTSRICSPILIKFVQHM